VERLQGYFHGTTTEYAKFFDEKRLARTAQAKDEGGGIASAPEPAVAVS
jgi:hypothetical protein